MEVEGVTAVHSTTHFVDDHVMVVKDESHVSHVDYSITKMGNTQNSIESVIDFLKKPIVLTTGNFALTDNFSLFNIYSMPYAALNSSDALIWRQKLAGFFGIRMDLRFRLVVNANKFQQGRYILGWTSTGGNDIVGSNLKAIEFLFAHNSTLVQRTTVPHVELDLSTQSSAELLVPYASVNTYYPLNSILAAQDRYGLGFISLYPYDPLQAPTGSTSCGYTLYVSMENVQLYGAASAQGGLSKREVANKNNGPISGVAGAISKGFKEFGNIPLIGEYAKGISWISDRIASTASIFGFSKPTAGDCIPKVTVMNAPSHTTVDGDSDARSLAFLNQPGVVPIKGLSGTDYDEMDFSYIKSKYAWFRTFTWALTSNVGQTLTSIPVSPKTGIVDVVANGFVYYNFTPVCFLSTQFRYWRGSLKFKFKIVKTEYHSGRLQFAFFPTDESIFVGQAAYVNRVIVDIREHSEIELVIPYISSSPWINVGSTGQLNVTVIDPLVAPSSVSPSINILVEIAGGEDFEVAAPGTHAYTPSILTPQGLDGPRTVENIYSSTIGDTVINSDPHLMSGLTIGDKVSSVRALVKRFTPLNISTGSVINMNTAGIAVVPDMIPFSLGTAASIPDRTILADSLTLWASCYTFMSGGIRLRDCVDYGLTDLSDKTKHTSLQAIVLEENISSNRMIYNTSIRGARLQNRVLHDASSNNTLTVEIPQYTKTYSRCILDCISFVNTVESATTAYNLRSTTPYRVVFAAPESLVITPQANHTFHRIFRAGADDFNLSGFISIPPMKDVPAGASLGFY